MSKKFTVLRLVALFFVFAVIMSCSKGSESVDAGEVKEIRLAHTLPQNHPVHQAYIKFSELVKEYTGGKYEIVIYPDAQLGNQTAAIQLTQSGGLEFVHMNAAILEGFEPIFTLINLPYIFKDYDHYTRVMTDPKIRELYEVLRSKNFIPIAHLEGGARSMYNKTRPIVTPADMKGLKIRVQESATHIEMIDLLGGSAVAMSPSEIYTALQQNVIDGAENNSPTFESQKHYEVTKYYSLTEHMRLSDFLAVGVPFWDTLTEEEQEQFLQAASEVSAEFSPVWNEGVATSDKILKDAGVTYNDVDQEAFRALVIPMHEEYGSKSPENAQWLEWVRSLEQ